jgi:hypothetical protein
VFSNPIITYCYIYYRIEDLTVAGLMLARFWKALGSRGTSGLITDVAIASCREIETPMAGKNSLLEDLYTDSGSFDAERAVEVLKSFLTIRRATLPLTRPTGGRE